MAVLVELPERGRERVVPHDGKSAAAQRRRDAGLFLEDLEPPATQVLRQTYVSASSASAAAASTGRPASRTRSSSVGWCRLRHSGNASLGSTGVGSTVQRAPPPTPGALLLHQIPASPGSRHFPEPPSETLRRSGSYGGVGQSQEVNGSAGGRTAAAGMSGSSASALPDILQPFLWPPRSESGARLRTRAPSPAVIAHPSWPPNNPALAGRQLEASLSGLSDSSPAGSGLRRSSSAAALTAGGRRPTPSPMTRAVGIPLPGQFEALMQVDPAAVAEGLPLRLQWWRWGG
eukprot:TRINITY_DN27206_c0_g1_i1.p1 TRINITY_DN27206_c0_g1~~TRINITY_DN27206_c0_g1_i1.p1  ORF type:complete len:289 (-),score=48.52 TRINITY_DN27206_c0_g1_i1:191-1057(-)